MCAGAYRIGKQARRYYDACMSLISVRLHLLPVMMAVLWLSSCEDAAQWQGEVLPGELRIITFSPAITQILVDLGYVDSIVGISEHDDMVSGDIPVVGHFRNVNIEMLMALRPTHVFMASGRRSVPERVRSMAENGRFRLVVYDYPETLASISTMIYATDGEVGPEAGEESIGDVLSCVSEARRLRSRFEVELSCLRRVVANQSRPEVLLAIGVNPVMACGRGTVHDQLLDVVGGVNAARASTLTAPVFDRESLIAMQPEVILLLLPNSPPLETRDVRLSAFEGLPIPAVKAGRIYLVNDPLVLLPGTSLPQCGLKLAGLIHPELSETLADRYEGCFSEWEQP